MKKQILALVCAMSIVFTACDTLGGGGGEKSNMQGRWITEPAQIQYYDANDTTNECWEYKLWCDGVTVATEYIWGPESAVIYMINASMTAEYKKLGAYHKKYWYQQVEEPTEAACTSRIWEGAECLLETISWDDENGNHQSQSEYFWIPEDSMKVRHDYYMNVTKAAEEASGKKFNFKHEYAKSEFTDADACRGQNEGDDQTVVIVDPNEPQTVDYSKYDNTTEKCWKVTQDKYTITVTSYVWMTERAMVELYDQMQLNYHYEEADAADEDACNELKEANDPISGEEACYKIKVSFTVAGHKVTEETYEWCTEEVAKGMASTLGGSYSKTKDKTQEACKAHNPQDED